MHIFLTGTKHVGKSTALRRFLTGQPGRLGGFHTVRTVQNNLVTVSILPANQSLPTPHDCVILTRDATGFHSRPERFNQLGCDYLSLPNPELIVMDELGPAEETATAFQQAVLSCLNGPIPVVGVVQQAHSAFLQQVCQHPKVRLLEVTAQNRDHIPAQMAALWPLRRVACVVMASGHSKRFGQDKLLYSLDGAPMLEWVLRSLPRDILSQILVVARTPPVLQLATSLGCTPVPNPDQTDDTAQTIRRGLESVSPQADGCLFCVADQPWLTPESIRRLILAFSRSPDSITALSWRGVRGNPILYPRSLFQALSTLEPGQSGRTVLAQHLSWLMCIEAGAARELRDVDVPTALHERLDAH